MEAKLLVALGLTIAWFLLAASCNGETDGLDSPQAVAERIQEIMESGEYGGMLDVIAPKDRDLVIGVLLVQVTMFGEKEDVAALEEKYRLSKRAPKQKMAGSQTQMRAAASKWLGDVDRRAVLADLLAALDKSSRTRLGGELTELKILGDTATGKLGGQPMRFLRLGGEWYMTIPDNA